MLYCTVCHELLTYEEANYASDDWYYEEPMCTECAPDSWKEIDSIQLFDDIEEDEDE